MNFKIDEDYENNENAKDLINQEKAKLKFNLVDKLYDIPWLYPIVIFFKSYR